MLAGPERSARARPARAQSFIVKKKDIKTECRIGFYNENQY